MKVVGKDLFLGPDKWSKIRGIFSFGPHVIDYLAFAGGVARAKHGVVRTKRF